MSRLKQYKSYIHKRQKIDQEIQEFAPFLSEYTMLKCIQTGIKTNKEIALELLMSSSAVSQMALKLEGQGLITRYKPLDKRKDIFQPTVQGLQFIQELEGGKYDKQGSNGTSNDSGGNDIRSN